MSIFSTLGGIATSVLDLNKAIFTNPITLVTKGPTAAIKESNKLTGTQAAVRTLETTAVASAAILTAGTSVGRTLAVKAATSLIPKTVIGKAAGIGVLALTAPVIAGLVTKSPTKAENILYNAPTAAAKAEKDIFNLTSQPLTVESGIDFVKTHPYLTATTAAVALGAAGYASLQIGSIISTYFSKKATQANTEAMLSASSTQTPIVNTTTSPVLPISSTPTMGDKLPYSEIPNPEAASLTQDVNPSPRATRRKKKKVSPNQNISQKVIIYEDDDDRRHYKTIKRRAS